MSLAPGIRLGSYEIVSALGAGGMGEVYRARDNRLNRDVAIKILPELFAASDDRTARFQREAQVLASLNHPNVGHIYGLEEYAAAGSGQAGRAALVLELVEGPTLADLVANGPIPLADALPMARQIIDALEAAHEHGIVHRDLKPANIKLTADGTIKVLDFGLAKALGASESEPYSGSAAHAGTRPSILSQSPTIASPAMHTHAGIILGTASYMSPEQARGKAVDKRTDIWAFGCVLYEMLTGSRAFDGEDVTDAIAKILQREPDYTFLDRHAPAPIRTLVRRCLEKDRKRRLADIADARFDLDSGAVDRERPAPLRRSWSIPAAVLVAALLGAVAATIVAPRRSTVGQPQPVRFQLNLPPELTDLGVAVVSPDGRHIAFTGSSGGSRSSMWLRALDAMSARLLPGTEGAGVPFWSPDGRFVGFASGGSLKKIDVSSGTVSTILAGSNGITSWGTRGTLLFSNDGALHSVSSTGTAGQVVMQPQQEASYNYPSFLPDGNHFLYADIRTIVPQRGAATIYVSSLESHQPKELVHADSRGLYANGHLLFVRDRTLLAQPFDVRSNTLTGEPFTVAEHVWAGAFGTPFFSASDTGVVAFQARDTPPSRLVWLDREGRRTGNITEPGDYSNPRVSPDGKMLAVGIYDRRARSRDIWVLDLERGTRSRLTSDPADEMNPVWSPDGTSIAFSSQKNGQRDLYRKDVHRHGEEQLVYASPLPESVSDWSPDGRQLLFHGPHEKGAGVSFIDASAHHGAKPVFWHISSNATNGQFSPNGNWLAYSSYESGRLEIYVAPVSGLGARTTVSPAGGIQPRWSRDGKELFYLTPARDKMMVVPVETQGTFKAGAARELFRLDVADALGHLYDVTPDGRFLVNELVGERIAPLTVVLNWTSVNK